MHNSILQWLDNSFVIWIALIIVIYLQWHFPKRKKEFAGKGQNELWGFHDIPGPPPSFPGFLFGNALQILPISGMFDKAVKWGTDYPDIFKLTFFNMKVVSLHGPELLQQLFRSQDFGHNMKAPVLYSTLQSFLSTGLLTSHGNLWKAQRKILNKSQKTENLKSYMKVFHRHGQSLVERLEKRFSDGGSHAINDELSATFLGIICDILLGSGDNYLPDEVTKFHEHVSNWKRTLLLRFDQPWLTFDIFWALHPMSRVQSHAISEMSKITRQIILEYKSNPERNLEYRSILDELISESMTDDQIVAEVNTLIFAGHDTGNTALHFFCFMMALHPEMQAKCQQEIDDTLENGNIYLTYDVAQNKLKYVDQCIQESLRLWPPVYHMYRQLETPLKLNHNSQSIILPVGTNLAISPYLVHRNPKIYPQPEKFDPERFLPEEIKKRHSCAFIPFAGGPRSCVGQRMAMLEMKVLAVYILRNFELRTKDKKSEIKLLPYITLTAENNFVFEIKKRKHF